jgi:hypothetical protein
MALHKTFGLGCIPGAVPGVWLFRGAVMAGHTILPDITGEREHLYLVIKSKFR